MSTKYDEYIHWTLWFLHVWRSKEIVEFKVFNILFWDFCVSQQLWTFHHGAMFECNLFQGEWIHSNYPWMTLILKKYELWQEFSEKQWENLRKVVNVAIYVKCYKCAINVAQKDMSEAILDNYFEYFDVAVRNDYKSENWHKNWVTYLF